MINWKRNSWRAQKPAARCKGRCRVKAMLPSNVGLWHELGRVSNCRNHELNKTIRKTNWLLGRITGNFWKFSKLKKKQCFDQSTDVLMLTTNLIKKDILKGSEFEAGLALGGLSCFMTPDLALDLTDDIISLMSSTRPYVRTSFDFKFDIYRTENFRTDERKRAVLVTYKLFLHYPEALRLALPRLRDKLTDKGRLKTIWKFENFEIFFLV